MIRVSRSRLRLSLCRQRTLTSGNRILCSSAQVRLVNKVQQKKNQPLTRQQRLPREVYPRGRRTLEEVGD